MANINFREPISDVVFDMAGTTVNDSFEDGSPIVATAFRQAFNAHLDNHGGPDFDLINSAMGWKKDVAIRAILARHYGIENADEGLVAAILHSFENDLMGHYYSPQAGEVEGTSEALVGLKDAGVKSWLNTGFQDRVADAIYDYSPQFGHWRANGLVQGMVHSGMVPNGRPTAEMIDAIRAMNPGLEASSMAKIGDTPSDIREGVNAGCAMAIGIVGTRSRLHLELAPFKVANHYDPDTFRDGNTLVLVVDQIRTAAEAVIQQNQGAEAFKDFLAENADRLSVLSPSVANDVFRRAHPFSTR